MKKSLSLILALLMCAAVIIGAASCKKSETPSTAGTSDSAAQTTEATNDEGLWENAIYKEDKDLGEGANTFTLKVSADDKTVVFTVKTDKETVGAALSELELIEGEGGMYTKVNGMTADWNVDKTYWAFYIGSDYAMTGLDETNIENGAEYSLVRTQG